MKLIVNIPAYNEEEKIGQTIHRIKESFSLPFYSQAGALITEKLIQVVNDGSKDQTAEVSQKAGADIVISHSTNRRLGVVFKTATESAIRQGADFFVNIDADGQFDPADIPALLKPLLENQADMVIASRFGSLRAKDIPFIKEFLNRFAARFIGFFLGQKIDDLTCGFRALNSETLLRLNPVSIFTYTQESIIDAIGKDLKLLWIPVKVTYYADRQSRMVKSIWNFINNSFKIIIKAVRDVRPLKFFGFPGLILVCIGLIGFGFFLFNYFQNFKISPYLNYIIFSAISVAIGIQLIIFALIADMIKSNRRISEEIIYRLKKEKFEKAKK